MKKLICLTFGLGLLTACHSIETDMDKAKAERDERRATLQSVEGCGSLDDNDAYRKCLLQTYENSTPKTFEPATLTNGQPIAVISDRKGASPQNPIEIPTAPVATMAGPVTAQISPMPVAPTAPCPQEVYETTVPADQVIIPCDTPPCTPVVTPVPAPIPVAAPQPQPQPVDTWWETYKQEEAKPVEPAPLPVEVEPAPIVVEPVPVVVAEPEPTLVCPCPDPNDPCPQCNEK